jgi:hypothetical protein
MTPEEKAEQKATVKRYTKLMRKMLPDKKVWYRTVRAFGRALAATPPSSDHGQLLASTLKTLSAGQQLADPSQRAVLWLARRGETPTAGAVTGRLDAVATEQKRPARQAGHWKRIHAEAEAIDDDLVVKYVGEINDTTGTGPLWSEVGRQFGLRYAVTQQVIMSLRCAGRLAYTKETRSLRTADEVTSS